MVFESVIPEHDNVIKLDNKFLSCFDTDSNKIKESYLPKNLVINGNVDTFVHSVRNENSNSFDNLMIYITSGIENQITFLELSSVSTYDDRQNSICFNNFLNNNSFIIESYDFIWSTFYEVGDYINVYFKFIYSNNDIIIYEFTYFTNVRGNSNNYTNDIKHGKISIYPNADLLIVSSYGNNVTNI